MCGNFGFLLPWDWEAETAGVWCFLVGQFFLQGFLGSWAEMWWSGAGAAREAAADGAVTGWAEQKGKGEVTYLPLI